MTEIRVLRYVIEIADSGSIVAAAVKLHVAQPSVSRQIMNLERRLGFDLFDRSPKGMSLTAAGRAYVSQARDLVDQANSLEIASKQIAKGTPAVLNIAAPMATITDILAPYIAQGGGIEGLNLDLTPSPTSGTVAVVGAEVDIAIASAPPSADLAWHILARVPLCAQVPKDHPLTANEQILVKDLTDETLIVRDGSHRIRVITDRAFASDSQKYSTLLECVVPRHAQALAAAGSGIAILTDAPAFGLQAVPVHTSEGPVEVPIYAVWRPNHYAKATITSLIKSIANYYKTRTLQLSVTG